MQLDYDSKKAHNFSLTITLIEWLSFEYGKITDEDKSKMKEKSKLILENHFNTNKEGTKKKLRT